MTEAKWLPIETALKDKTIILVGSTQHANVDTAIWDGSNWVDTSEEYSIRRQVTHWMPLPPPPK